MQRRTIPDGWRQCVPTANKLIADLFLVFRTPLSSNYDNLLSPELIFHPKIIFEYGAREELIFGLWFDLTLSDKFYDATEVSKEGCTYVKLECRGVPPSRQITDSFIDVTENFVKEHPGEKVAVHCAHGFNRSGFLVISYLVEKRGFRLDEAISMFADARPPGIQKVSFLAELAKRYGGG